MNLHPLLKRQLKRLGIDADSRLVEAPAWVALLERVSRAYAEHDQDRYLLERSQELASNEMTQLNAALKAERDLLEARVDERTRALQLSEARLSSLVSLSADWVWEQDADMRFTYLSIGVLHAIGVDPASLLGRRREADEGFTSDAQDWSDYVAAVQARKAFRDFSYTFQPPGAASPHYICISGEPVFGPDGSFQGYRGIGRDITKSTVAEQQVHRLARYDSLTGLANRNMFLDELERALARARRKQDPLALFFIDLDRFKAVNDTLGHAAGDELLQTMAQRLRNTVRSSDTLARLGGDEFVLLTEGCGETADLLQLGEKLLRALGQPVTLQRRDFLVTGSVGVARFPTDGDDALTLLKHADAAMYLAKAQGKNNVQVYSAELASVAERAFEVESDLRQAIARSDLLLYYQPKVDVQTRQLLGMEALLRWKHPTRGMVPPNEFIPVAEENGLIIPIGRWVLQAACAQIGAWRAQGLAVPPVSVNLSAKQFADNALTDDIVAAMTSHGVQPADLEMELTESALMAEPERANAVLRKLHGMGVKVSIDDFGTGYSSLSYLKRFPASTVKIDRSFISGLPSDHDDLAITQAVIAMAHSLGLQVVAEGVETEAQLCALQGMGCDLAQGYLLGRPMGAEEMAKRLPVAQMPTPTQMVCPAFAEAARPPRLSAVPGTPSQSFSSVRPPLPSEGLQKLTPWPTAAAGSG